MSLQCCLITINKRNGSTLVNAPLIWCYRVYAILYKHSRKSKEYKTHKVGIGFKCCHMTNARTCSRLSPCVNIPPNALTLLIEEQPLKSNLWTFPNALTSLILEQRLKSNVWTFPSVLTSLIPSQPLKVNVSNALTSLILEQPLKFNVWTFSSVLTSLIPSQPLKFNVWTFPNGTYITNFKTKTQIQFVNIPQSTNEWRMHQWVKVGAKGLWC